MSDFVLGLILFVVFIIFMALWLHFQLPESHQDPSADISSGTMPAEHATLDEK